MGFRKKILDTPQHPSNLEALTGRRPLERFPVRDVFVAQDSQPAHTRRVLLEVGLHGADDWQVPDTPVVPGVQSRPVRFVQRWVARSPPLRLSPGSFVRMVAVCLPCGLTMRLDDDDVWQADTPAGEVGVVITFRNGADTSTVEAALLPALSLSANGAQPQGDAAAFGGLQRMRTALLLPAEIVDDQTLTDWSDGTTAEIAVYYMGAPRALDVVVVEEPFAFAADDTGAGFWPAPLMVDPEGNSLPGLAHEFPVYQAKVGQLGGGTYVLADAALREREMGPMLWAYTAYLESDASINATEVEALTLTSTTFLEMLTQTTTTAHDPTTPGVSLSCGANARVQGVSHHTLVLRDNDNVVPVRCWILAKMASGGQIGTVRFTSVDYSSVEVVVTGTDWAWFSATGHLRCGLGPELDTVQPQVSHLQVFAKVSAGTLSWRAMSVEYAHLA